MTIDDAARDRGPGRRLTPALAGLGAGLVVHLTALAVLGAVVLRNASPDTSIGATGVGTGFLLLVAGPGALGLALACAVAARVCLWRCRTRQVPAAAGRRTALIVGSVLGTALVTVGLVLALRWTTLPLYVLGAAAGTALGVRTRGDHARIG
jgi:hypothetical protein